MSEVKSGESVDGRKKFILLFCVVVDVAENENKRKILRKVVRVLCYNYRSKFVTILASFISLLSPDPLQRDQ